MPDRGESQETEHRAGKSLRGFAVMDHAKQREIASKGGKAAHEKGTAHEFDSEQAKRAGRKGGEIVSRNRQHMAEIGRKGGQSVSSDRDHMSEIGRRGGEAVSQDRGHMSEIGRKGGESISTDRQHMSSIGREGGSSRAHETDGSDESEPSGSDDFSHRHHQP